MKKLLLNIFFLFLVAFSAISQTNGPNFVQPELFQSMRGVVEVDGSQMVAGTTNEYNIKIQDFIDVTNKFDVFAIEVGDWLWTDAVIPGECNRFQILEITFAGVPGVYTLRCLNPDRSGPDGNAQVGEAFPIMAHTECRDYPLFIPSVPSAEGFVDPKVQVCMHSHFRQSLDAEMCEVQEVIDSIQNPPCNQITQQNHGFAVGDLIHVGQGGVFMYSDTTNFNDGIVVQVYNANDFEVIFNSNMVTVPSHSYPIGEWMYAGGPNQLSTTPSQAANHPVLKAISSTCLLFPNYRPTGCPTGDLEVTITSN